MSGGISPPLAVIFPSVSIYRPLLTRLEALVFAVDQDRRCALAGLALADALLRYLNPGVAALSATRLLPRHRPRMYRHAAAGLTAHGHAATLVAAAPLLVAAAAIVDRPATALPCTAAALLAAELSIVDRPATARSTAAL